MFYDLGNIPIVSYEQAVSPGQTIVFQTKADCKTGKFLRASEVEGFTFEGRFAGAGSFVNLVTTGLDVGAFNGLKKTFDIRVTVDSDAGVGFENADFRIKS